MSREAMLAFVGAAGATALLVAGALLLLRPHLLRVLVELCGGEARGRFWQRAVEVCALLAALAGSCLPASLPRRDAVDATALAATAVLQVAAGLAGTLVVLATMALLLLPLIRRFEVRSALEKET